MKISVDTTGNDTDQTYRTSASINLTIGNNSTFVILFGFSNYWGGKGTTNISIGGKNFTSLFNRTSYGVYYVTKPPTGSQTISISWQYSYQILWGAISFNFVDYNNPFAFQEQFNSGSGTTLTCTISGMNTKYYIVQTGIISPGGAANSATPLDSQIEVVNKNDDDPSPQKRGLMSYINAILGDNTLRYSLNASFVWQTSLTALKPIPFPAKVVIV